MGSRGRSGVGHQHGHGKGEPHRPAESDSVREHERGRHRLAALRPGRGRCEQPDQGLHLDAERRPGSDDQLQRQRQSRPGIRDAVLPDGLVWRPGRAADDDHRAYPRHHPGALRARRDHRPHRLRLVVVVQRHSTGDLDERHLPGEDDQHARLPGLHDLRGPGRAPRGDRLPAADQHVRGLQQLPRRPRHRQEPVRLRQLRRQHHRRHDARGQGVIQPPLQ